MGSLTIAVLLACACLAIQAQQPRQDCIKIRKGSTTGFKHFVKPIVLPKKTKHWEQKLPHCPSGKTHGVDVQACDEAQIPELKFVGNSWVALNRNGDLASYIVVVINMFCATPQEGSAEIL